MRLEKSTVGIFSVIAALPFLVGGILWLSEIANATEEIPFIKDELKEIKKDQKTYNEAVIRIDERFKHLEKYFKNKGE